MNKLLTDVSGIQYGYAFDSALFSTDNGLPIVRIRDVVRGFSETRTTESCPKNYYVYDGDILVGMDGEFNIAKWYGGKAVLNQRVCKLIPKDEEIEADYLFYYMPKALKAIEDKTPFVTVKHLSAKELNKVVIPVPNREKQTYIVKVLRLINSLLVKYQTETMKLDELIKSRFGEMFGDIGTNSKGWILIQLKEVAEIRIGPFGSLLHKEDYVCNCHALVNPSHIVDGKIKTDEKLTINNEKYQEMTAYHLQKDDIVLGRRGEMGRCAVVEQEGLLCGTGSMIIRPNGKIKPFFLQTILSSPLYKRILEDKAVGVTMLNLNVPIVSSITIPLLPIELQDRFIELLQSVEKQKATVQQSIKKLETLKKSLMQEYFN